jgi:hypothetical protein
MALIIDPDFLHDAPLSTDDGYEVFIDTANLQIELHTDGYLSTDGVALKCLYSFLKEEWRTDPNLKNLAAFPFPMTPITDESFEFIDGWNFDGYQSQNLIRTGGWTVRNTSGNVTEKWAGIIGLGTIEANDQLYYYQGVEAENVVLQGQVNQAVAILNDPNGDGTFTDGYDYRTVFTIFCREYSQAYDSSALSDIGVVTMDSIAYRFPLSTSTDLKITHDDSTVSTTAPYTGMSITYYATPQSRTIGTSNYNFGIIVDGNNGTAEQIYEFVQYKLRQDSDIDSGGETIIGKTADELLRFVGDTLYTRTATNPAGGGTGVFIDNYQVVDVNRLVFVDNTTAQRTFPYVAAFTLTFGPNLSGDASARYWVFFTDLPGSADYGNTSGVLVEDADGYDMYGDVSGNTTIQHSFAYDTNNQGGRTPATDAAVTVVAIGLSTGQYVRATSTITRSTSNVVSLVAALERNYSNPA